MVSTGSANFSQFLIHLASRRYRENDLSDVTWAVCQTAPRFAAALCEALGFPACSGGPIEAVREYSLQSGGRPDFCFISESPFLVVEVKLNDRNYHFNQYASGLPLGVGRVLLTNHRLDGPATSEAESHEWGVVNWLDLLDRLSSLDFEEDQALIDGYLHFARKLCGARTVQEIRFENQSLYSLGLLYQLLQQTIRRYDDPRACISPHQAPGRAFTETSTGAYYHLQLSRQPQREAWLFFGLVYEKPAAFLTVAVDKDLNTDLVAALEKYVGTEAAGVLVRRYVTKDGIDLQMPARAFEEFNGTAANDQERQLRSWFAAANELLISCL